MGSEFYRAFEDKHRGDRDLIKSRLEVYRPFVKDVHAQHLDAPALDLGCGRGEWLELMGELGIGARGVDLDDAMLASCRRRGLDVVTQDALEAVRQCADDSQGLVTAFHLAEHLPFDVLQELVREAHRALVPGGLLILETPNPENLTVAAHSFFLDPTHERPIPPQLLEFMLRYVGFATVKMLRLQEDPWLAGRGEATAVDLLNGVSPDYALVARKESDAPLSAAFDQEYGLSPESLAERYYRRIEQNVARFENVEGRALRLEVRMHEVEARALRLEVRANEMEERAYRAEVRIVELETTIVNVNTLLATITGSLTWRIVRRLGAIRWALLGLLKRGGPAQ